MGSDQQSSAWNTTKWAVMNTNTVLILLVAIQVTWTLPLATQEDVEKDIADVADLKETPFSQEVRDAKSIIEESIDDVRDLEETEFAAEPRDSEAALLEFIMGVRNLELPEFSKNVNE